MTTSALFRIVAAAFALGGIITMMVQPEPFWKGVSSGLFGLTMFVGFSAIAWFIPTACRKRRNFEIFIETLKPIYLEPTKNPGASTLTAT